MPERLNHVYTCANHPMVPTGSICAHCGRPFCENCLTEMMGRRLCGWCRDFHVSRLQTQASVDPRTVVIWARVFDWVMLVGGLGTGVLIAGFFSLPFWLGSSTEGTGSAADRIPFIVMLSVTISLALLWVLIFLPPAWKLGPGRGYLWVWQIIALVAGVLGTCVVGSYFSVFTVIPGIVLFVYWLKPEVRSYCE
jgi:hypothetical protein